jgi:ribonuclease HI
VKGEAMYYGQQAQPNNVAEAQAMVEAVRLTIDHIDPEGPRTTVAVVGDSDLIIKFMTKAYKPQKKDLVRLVKEGRDLIATNRKINFVFLHVPRLQNQWADWLS